MRSSRRVLLLTGVAIVCGALIVTVTLVGLAGPEHDLGELERRVLPASEALEATSAASIESQQAFVAALSAPVEQRGELIADAQAASTRASAAWRAYQRDADDSPAERRLQRRYERLLREGQSVGASVFALVDVPLSPEYQALLTRERALTDQEVTTLQQIERRFYTPRIGHQLAAANAAIDDTRGWVLLAFGFVLVAGLANAAVLFRGALREERLAAAINDERLEGQRRADLENELQRGLEMEPVEELTYGVIGAALELVRPDEPAELIVADSSRAHFRQVLSTDHQGHGPGCTVPSPAECPAAISGQTRLFASGTRLDACPFLRERERPERSAACVPVSIAGTTTGVIHTTGPDGEVVPPRELADMELIARKAGDRIGFLRVLARTETHARVDVLTGLFNRRTIEQDAREVLRHGDEFVVAFADLDHFKNLNDEHGHEVGDRALRLFGRVLRDSVRPTDVPARYGGEEFVVMLPDCSLADARVIAERVRDQLAKGVDASTVPTFTVSIGLAAWMAPETFDDTVARADAALLRAKAMGRDRVVISTDLPRVEPSPDSGAPTEQGPKDTAGDTAGDTEQKPAS